MKAYKKQYISSPLLYYTLLALLVLWQGLMLAWLVWQAGGLLWEVKDGCVFIGQVDETFFDCAFYYMYTSLSYLAIYWTWGTVVFGVFALLLRPFVKVIPDEIETDRNEYGF